MTRRVTGADIRKRHSAAGRCRCGRPRAEGVKRCQQCVEDGKKTKKKRYERCKEEGRCYFCPRPACEGQTWCDYHRQRSMTTRAARKDMVFDAYGGYRCNCCGETIREFLDIDHVNNDGAAHRRLTGGAADALYRWLIKNKFPSGFQVLCINCNVGKYKNGGVCPHERIRAEGGIVLPASAVIFNQMETSHGKVEG